MGESGRGGVDDPARGEVTLLLERLQNGDRSAADRLLPMVYDELRAVARRALRSERPDHTLQATALVHEAWLRLGNDDRIAWQGRAHFLGIAARSMRQILVDHARRRRRDKRGGDWQRVTFDGAAGDVAGPGGIDLDVLDLNAALERLAERSERQARVVELRYFGGLTIAETAEALGVATSTVEADWAMARTWLFRELRRP